MRDQIRLDRLVSGEEALHIDDQVFDDRKTQKRLDGDPVADFAHQHLAGQPVAAIDAHGIRTANSVGARSTVREGAVFVPLDLVQRVEHAIGLFGLDACIPERSVCHRSPGCSA